jgi:hypothetical protein
MVEGIEVDGVVEAVGVARELMRAAHTEHVEAYGRHVAEERHVARSRQRVGRIGTIESGSHESDAELGVGAVVRSADDTEVETLVLLLLVGIVEVGKETTEDVFLLCRLRSNGVSNSSNLTGCCTRYKSGIKTERLCSPNGLQSY